jgi:hypothetical protein
MAVVAEPTAAAGSSADALAGVRNIATRIANFRGAYPNQDMVDFQTVHATMKDLNALIASAKTTGGAEFGKLMQLKKGFWEALEKATTTGTGEALTKLKAANMAMRNEIAADTVDDVVFKNFGQALEGTGEWSSAAAQAHRQLSKAVRDDPFLKDSFKASDLDRVLKSFDEIRQLPVRGAPAGADAGSKNILKRTVVGGGLGELIGQAVGAPSGTGSMVGSVAGVMGSEVIAKAVTTPKGSKMIVDMLKSPHGIGNAQLAAIGMYVRASLAETKEYQEGFQQAMKDAAIPVQEKLRQAAERSQLKQEGAEVEQQLSIWGIK